MSLTSILKEAKYRSMFKDRFPKPECNLSGEMLACPQTKNYAIIGTAFDYILRFYIEMTNPDVKSTVWIAEHGLNELRLRSGDYIYEYAGDKMRIIKNDSGESLQNEDSDICRKLYLDLEIKYEQIRKEYKQYLNDGIMTRDLLGGSIVLAQLDGVYRARYINGFNPIDEKDIDDLENLLNVAKKIDFFSTSSKCLLDPTFGQGSKLVGGADADLIIGDTLIDIKTVMQPTQKYLDVWLQIVGYYILNMINNDEYKIKSIGVYFSRHGMLRTFPVNMLGDIDSFIDSFIQSFKKENISGYAEDKHLKPTIGDIKKFTDKNPKLLTKIKDFFQSK